MKILLIFTFFIISGAVRCLDVIGYSGESVLVNSWKSCCKNCYKYMNRLKPWKQIIINKKHKQWINEGRFTLYCNNDGNLMIYIKDLNTEDFGTYEIGFDDQWSTDLTLTVIEDSCCGASQTVMVNTGETANFRCQYSQDYKNYYKIVFKEGKDSIDEVIHPFNTWRNKERFSIFDDRDKNLFSVKITDVRSEDAGVYLCGVHRYRYSYSYSIITAVHLNIMNLCCVASQTVMVNTGETANFTCQYSQDYKYYYKIVLKEGKDSTGIIYRTDTQKKEERFSISDDRDKNLFNVKITDVRSEDAGVYLCGVQRYRDSYSYSIITAVHLNIINSCCGASQTVMVNTGETANFRCQYAQDQQNNEKILLKKENDTIDMLLSTKNLQDKKEKLKIYDNTQNKVLHVRMTDVRSEDAGVYLCGVFRDSYTYSIITAVHLNIMSKVGVVKVSGYSAGQIIFKCHHPQYKNNPKYLCKESDGCSERKSPSVQDQWMKNGDVSLYDDTTAGVLMVYFRDLNAGDAGTYRCGVNVSQYTESFTEIQMDIKQALTHWWVNKSVYVGDEVNISCQIPEEHQVSTKLFCKEDENHICQNINTSEVKLNDLSPKSVFTVTISNVTVRDAGVYWCGAETPERDLSFISLTTKIQLNLIMPSVFGDEGGSAQIICPYDPIYKSKSKYLCKSSTTDRNPLIETVRDENEMNRLTVNDDMTASVFTVNITGLTAEDAGKYCCTVRLETDVIYLYTHLIIIMNEEMILNKREGDNMSIQCKHHAEYQKLFCKAHEPSMCVNDGVLLQSMRDNETSAGVFTVNISNLREEDSGIYWCGSRIINKVRLEVKKSVFEKIIACICVTLLLIGALILLLYKLRYIKTPENNFSTDRTQRTIGEVSNTACDYENFKDVRQHLDCEEAGHVEVATETVTGITGESLMINCQYPHQTLKDAERSFCKIPDNTCAATTEAQSDLWINEEKFSMYDNTSVGWMSVLIRNLTLIDRGTYKCKVDGKMILHLDLNVEHDTCCGRSESHTGYLGESVTISCKYPLKYKDYPKLLYKVQDKVPQSVIFLLGYSHTEGRFSLTDNSAETLFTVTINQVNRDDDGIYLCGLTNPNYIHLLTEIHLTVSYFHVIIIVCVCLTLLIGGLGLLLFTLRCKKTKDTISSSNQRNTRGKCDELSTELYYKTMKESETGSTTIKPSINLVNTVYATAELPTSPSDRDFYTLAEQPKIPSDT